MPTVAEDAECPLWACMLQLAPGPVCRVHFPYPLNPCQVWPHPVSGMVEGAQGNPFDFCFACSHLHRTSSSSGGCAEPVGLTGRARFQHDIFLKPDFVSSTGSQARREVACRCRPDGSTSPGFTRVLIPAPKEADDIYDLYEMVTFGMCFTPGCFAKKFCRNAVSFFSHSATTASSSASTRALARVRVSSPW